MSLASSSVILASSGTVLASAGGGVTLLGVSATGAAGALAVSGVTSVALSGVGATGSPGQFFVASQPVVLVGVGATGSISSLSGVEFVEVVGAVATRIEMQFTPGMWTSVGNDLLGSVRLFRGSRGNSPRDTVASTGTMEFALRNDAGNSGGVIGYYSPNHTNCRSGFTYGIPVRAVFRYNSTDYIRWTGKLRRIDPLPGLHGPRRTLCLAQDVMGDLASVDVREVTRQLNQRDDTLLHVIFDSLPTESQPLARQFDGGLSIFPVAFDDLHGGIRGLSLAERVVTSAQGRLFPLGDGTMRYQNSATVALATSQSTFDDDELVELEASSDLENVFNRVRIVTHPKTFSASTIVLTTHVGTLELTAGQSLELFLDYRDPDRPEVAIGAASVEVPVPLTDYRFTANADGTGADLTADIDVTVSAFGSTAKVTLDNTGATTAHKQLLQLRGIGIYDQTPVPVEAFTAQSYGNREIEIDTPYQSDQIAAKELAEFIQENYRSVENQVNGIAWWGTTNATILDALTLELGEMVTVSESVALPDAVRAYIQSLEMMAQAGKPLRCRIGLAPRLSTGVGHADTMAWTDSPSVTSPAPETRIDVAQIDWSEIAA